jgi:hypothetical protein
MIVVVHISRLYVGFGYAYLIPHGRRLERGREYN